jgi:hypothetical protein
MNKRILGNILVCFHSNEQKPMDRAKLGAISKWDRLQAKTLWHLELPKPTSMKLVPSRLFWLIGISKWGNGFILGYRIPLVERDDGLAKLIHGSKASYVKALKATTNFHPHNTPIKSSTNKSIFLHNMPRTNIKIKIFNLEVYFNY